jgi:hypothetical protein
MNDNNNFAYKLGQFLGGVVLSCIAVSIASVLIALTLKLMFWIF